MDSQKEAEQPMRIITPETVQSTSFTEQVSMYTQVTNDLNQAREDMLAAKRELKEYLMSAPMSIEYVKLNGQPFESVEKYIVVYKPKDTSKDSYQEDLATCGTFMDGGFSTVVLKVIEKYAPGFTKFMNDLQEYEEPEAEIDEEATKAEKTKFREILKKNDVLLDKLRTLEIRKEDMVKLVEFYKNIAVLADAKKNN